MNEQNEPFESIFMKCLSKVGYLLYDDAWQQKMWWQKKKGIVVYPYQCEHCDHWHLSKHPYELHKKRDANFTTVYGSKYQAFKDKLDYVDWRLTPLFLGKYWMGGRDE